MPELPEVETISRSLTEKIIGKKIFQVEVFMAKLIKTHHVEQFKAVLKGLTIRDIARRGKYLIINFQEGWSLVVHLRMTGQLVVRQAQDEIIKHTHAVFTFEDKTQLRFIDIRQFGTMHLVMNDKLDEISGIQTLGPEPLGEDFTLPYLISALAGKKTKIKAFLLDQKWIAGLGNIYVDEALFQAKIHPLKEAGNLTRTEIERLFHAVRETIKAGIEHRGTTLKDYVDAEGNKGTFQFRLKAYGRSGQACSTCGSLIIREKVAGRSSHICPKCQILDTLDNNMVTE